MEIGPEVQSCLRIALVLVISVCIAVRPIQGCRFVRPNAKRLTGACFDQHKLDPPGVIYIQTGELGAISHAEYESAPALVNEITRIRRSDIGFCSRPDPSVGERLASASTSSAANFGQVAADPEQAPNTVPIPHDFFGIWVPAAREIACT